jgi:hypothetical protein
MADKVKYLTENGVRRLWAAIEQKFIDNDELTTGVQAMIDDSLTDAEAMSNADIDAITGYQEPQANPGE